MKHLFRLFFLVFALSTMISCGNGNSSSESYESEIVEVGDNDRSIQSYIPNPQKALLNRSSLTFEDMIPSCRLLLTPGGELKGISSSDGYQKVTSYTCISIGDGWYFVECQYKDNSRTNDWECYIREKI